MSSRYFFWECRHAHLKEINKPKRHGAAFSCLIEMVFGFTETVVSVNEDGKDCSQCLNLSGETPASSGKDGDVVAQVGVYTFYGKGVAFVTNVSFVVSWVDDIYVAQIAVCEIVLSRRSVINHFLYALWGFVICNIKTYYLAGLAAYHGHQIYVFSCFRAWFVENIPIELVHFQYFGRVIHSWFSFF